MKPKEKHTPPWWTVFAIEYLKTSSIGTSMKKARPNLKLPTCQVLGSRLLRNVKFQEFLRTKNGSAEYVCDYTKEEYFNSLTARARFDLAQIFMVDDITKEVKIRPDWLTKAKGGVIEKIQIDCMTLESGQVLQRIKLQPYSRADANEKLGKLLGFDTTKEDGGGQTVIEINWNPQFDISGRDKAVKRLENQKTIDISSRDKK